MTWHLTDDVAAFRAAAGPFLAADPARNTVLLTVAEGAREGHWPGARFGWWTGSGSAVGGAYLQTPGMPPVLGTMPDGAAQELAGALRGEALVGVNGATATARAFGEAWGPYQVDRQERLFRLAELADPAPVVGRARLATEADLPVVTAWMTAFLEEVALPPGLGAAAAAARRTAAGQLVLWETDEGPVSLAASSAVLAGQSRIGPVYTPPALRGRGFAAVATAAATRLALEWGAEQVVLFTDLANATSNALYQRLGYRQVQDHLVLDFTGGAG
ncbi:GNAT family N-acetyltransferase [Streptomyces sp. TLI_146]|uniref:GNAT family N-acetyltransferase n=1 Tax=Streptomyces sp. TLI_146 TaxID=1938858 RepID=UPI000C70CF45|nr:GNAT family N-acetyltransferase [Streptomyces sp. TLI_146]PKV89836.1 FR47-like protein [Streptomyces sp. TLI_146]